VTVVVHVETVVYVVLPDGRMAMHTISGVVCSASGSVLPNRRVRAVNMLVGPSSDRRRCTRC
jgi:hypothetical protein